MREDDAERTRQLWRMWIRDHERSTDGYPSRAGDTPDAEDADPCE